MDFTSMPKSVTELESVSLRFASAILMKIKTSTYLFEPSVPLRLCIKPYLEELARVLIEIFIKIFYLICKVEVLSE